MPDISDRVKALLDEFDIRIVPANQYPGPGETRAVDTIERIIGKRGEPHARLVLSALVETKGNGGLLDKTALWAVSDLFTACADILDADASAVLELFDTLPLGPFMAITNELAGIIPQRPALAGLLYLYLRRLREDTLTARPTIATKRARANRSQADKGQPAFSDKRRRLSADEKATVGRELLDRKRQIDRGKFYRWVIEESGYTYAMALQCMKLAREAGNAQVAA